MCGIVGYIGPRNAAQVLFEGLKRLEYRGYDSAGMAVHDGSRLVLVRAVGKLDNLVKAVDAKPLSGNLGVGHTRWATHGRPSETNAHPHLAGDVALVHNGIIENHLELKRELEAQGVRFLSDTDTEIAAQLVARAFEHSGCLLSAVRSALRQIRGAYALAVTSAREPGRLIIAKQASPLVVGIADGETLCASDVPALLGYTRHVVFLEDGELAELRADQVRIENLDGQVVVREPRRIDWSPVQAEKGGFKHFMLKEIFEQPRAIEDTLRGRVELEKAEIVASDFGLAPEVTSQIERVVLLACGTSYHAALAGRYWLEQIACIPAHAELASEVRYRNPVFGPRDLVIGISQSGETADTLAALKAAGEAGASLLALANVLDSAIPRYAKATLYTHAGPEIGVASTKCFTAQLVALLMLAILLGRQRKTLEASRARELLQALLETPNAMRQVLDRHAEVQRVAKRFRHAEHMLFLGRGLSFPIALEGALKLKEISYCHAEGYAAGEMKHGPIALIDAQMPVVVVAPRDAHFEKTFSNLQEVRARDGQIITITTDDSTDDQDPLEAVSAHVIRLPVAPPEILPLLTVLPLQLLAYYIADFRGTDVDQPRNLAKTVTVE